ncbi:MAG TPA: DUF86 domain-containing protein [Pyrinomonadaceae bacterium]|nr:DUF86 domain-containing protein [Pyrinomonadaceae bacterium]
MKARNDDLYLYDIEKCCEKIETYIGGINYDQFLENPMLQDALVRNIEIIGEAAKNLSEDFRTSTPEVVWRDIMRMRDTVVHHYFRLNLEVIWQTAADDIPKLLLQIKEIAKQD